MDNLKVVYGVMVFSEGAKVIEIEVIKETAKQYRLGKNPFYKTILNKSELPICETYSGVIGINKEDVIARWNNIIDKKIAQMQKSIAQRQKEYCK